MTLNELARFHFLQPLWLLLLIPAALLIWQIGRSQSAQHAWRRVMAPHLLTHLLLNAQDNSGPWRPLYGLGLFWLLGIIALAGPTWQRLPSPFAEDQAALVIVLKVTPSMLAQDIQPSRLERSVHKVRDLLQRRGSGRSALIAYSGSAHLVIPLTRDARIIELFAAELSPEIMPQAGDAAAQAVTLANQRLAKAGTSGSILLLADAVAADQLQALKQQRAQGGAPVQLLAMAAGPDVVAPPDSPPAPALDQTAMAQAAEAAGGSLILPSADDGDIARLARLIEHQLTQAERQEGESWHNAGYYLVPLLALLVLVSFRRGWNVRYQ